MVHINFNKALILNLDISLFCIHLFHCGAYIFVGGVFREFKDEVTLHADCRLRRERLRKFICDVPVALLNELYE